MEMEQEHKHGDYIEDENALRKTYTHYVRNAILTSYRFVESAINEAIVDMIVDEKMPSRVQMELENDTIEDMRVLDTAFRGGLSELSLFPKVQTTMVVVDSEPFNRGHAPMQEILTLNRLRNRFEHHEPKSIEHEDLPRIGEDIQSSLRSFAEEKPKTNPFSHDDEPYFPVKCMSSTCSGWAYSTAEEFVQEFYTRLGIDWPAISTSNG